MFMIPQEDWLMQSPLSSLFFFSLLSDALLTNETEGKMVTVGFDVGKKELVGARIDRSVQMKELYRIENSPEAINKFLDQLSAKFRHLQIGSEATAEYHRILALSCLDRNIKFRLLNPIITKQFTRATVRKKKSDPSDALVIAKLCSQGEGRIVVKDDFNSNKAILRTSVKLSNMAQSLALIKKRVEDNYPDEVTSIKIIDKCLSTIQEGIKELRTEGKSENKDLLQLLQSLPGIGVTTANTLIAEIIDINRFKDSKSLTAYSGLDPRIRQSGLTLQKNTKLTKRGSPYLRRAIFTAASIGLRHDPELQTYYLKKRAEGKSYKEAVIATSKKLINRIYSVWKRKKPYVKVQVLT